MRLVNKYERENPNRVAALERECKELRLKLEAAESNNAELKAEMRAARFQIAGLANGGEESRKAFAALEAHMIAEAKELRYRLTYFAPVDTESTVDVMNAKKEYEDMFKTFEDLRWQVTRLNTCPNPCEGTKIQILASEVANLGFDIDKYGTSMGVAMQSE